MAGVYLHIPFCRKKCAYCDFVSFPLAQDVQQRYAQAVVQEICRRAPQMRRIAFETLFVGGGTPSVLDLALLAQMVEALQTHLTLGRTEWTIEANPESITAQKLDAWREMGFNRISIGVQSFCDAQLQAVGRLHDAQTARRAVCLAQASGFERTSVDLICGLPGQDEASLLQSVTCAAQLGVGHVSVYQLQLEEATPLTAAVRAGRVQVPDDDQTAQMMDRAIALLARLGYGRYEVSNFAKPGQECRHNQGYWRRSPYAGFGLAAHSFLDGRRIANTSELAAYLAGDTCQSVQTLTPRDAHEETLMLSLRTREGVPAAALSQTERTRADDFVEKGLLFFRQDAYCATLRGYEVLNSLIVALLDDIQ